MPIVIKNFSWKQTEAIITIYVPIKVLVTSRADILTAATYVKVSYEKYFFEVFLLNEIDPRKSSCIIAQNEIVFQLEKCENALWDKLEKQLTRTERNELKKEIIDGAHQLFQKEVEGKENKKHELKRVAVRQQIALDTKQRNTIDKIRNEEKDLALGDVNSWREEAKITELSDGETTETESSSDEDNTEISNEYTSKPNASETKNKGTINDETETSVREINNKNITESKSNQIPKSPNYSRVTQRILSGRFIKPESSSTVSIPLPRQQAIVSVSFTERAFPTPSRESKLEEEQQWLQKQIEAQRSVGFASVDLRPEEKNPLFLKTKGDSFLKAKNYLAAISAYTFGIRLSEKYVDLWIGRSEAHFALEHYEKTIRDCSAALDLLKPAVSSNLHQRVTCILRRGESLCRIERYREGISELEAALNLQPDNDEIRMQIEKNILSYKQKMKEEQEKKEDEEETDTKGEENVV